MPPRPKPLPALTHLPVPTAAEAERFRRLHREHIGVDLDSATAARTLAELAQFYFLTHGHERYRLLQQSHVKQSSDRQSQEQQSGDGASQS